MTNPLRKKKYSIVLFLGLAFGISWLLLLPVIKSSESLNSPLMLLLYILSSFGPGLAAILIIRQTKGWDEVKSLFQSLVTWQDKPLWLTTSIALPVLVTIIAVGILAFKHGMSLSVISFGRWLLSIPNLILNLFLFGLISNEIGWRGFLLPKLQKNRSAIVSSFIVGALWALWQVPTLYVSGIVQSHQSITWLFIEVIALSVILTWLYNSTGSLFFSLTFNAIYMTLSQTISPAVQFSGNIDLYQQTNSIILVNIALLIVLFCGGKRLVFQKPNLKSPDE